MARHLGDNTSSWQSAKRILALGLLAAVPAIAASVDPSILAKRDESFREGTIRFTYSMPEWTTHQGVRQPAARHMGTLIFSPDGRMLERLENPKTLGPNVKAWTYVKRPDGRYTEVEDDSGITVTFSNDRSWPRLELPDQYLVEKPCAPVGLGLGAATNISIQRGENKTSIKGTLPSREKFAFTMDSAGSPLSLEIKAASSFVKLWSYEGAIKVGEVAFPRKASFSYGKGSLQVAQAYEFHDIDLTRPSEQDLETKWFRKGVTIIDRRVDPVATWTYEKLKKANGDKEDISISDLHSMSQSLSSYFARQERKRERQITMEKGSESKISFALFAALAVPALLSLFFGVRFLSRPK